MSKAKGRVVTTDAEIDAAIAQAKVYDTYRPKAVAVVYRAQDNVVAIILATGAQLVLPLHLLEGIADATPEQVADVRIEDFGSSLYWPQLDIAHYVPGLIDGVFGTRQWMSEIGKQGGAVRSTVKAEKARENGRKGGRPPKKRATA